MCVNRSLRVSCIVLLCAQTKAFSVHCKVGLRDPDFLTSPHNPPHLACCISSPNMHQWVPFSMTQQCMLKQDEVMVSLSNTVVLTTSSSTMRS